MGFSYLNGGNWLDITREERLFCSHLYHDIRGREKWFVEWLDKQCTLGIPAMCEWEIGFEVCFYRDLKAAMPDVDFQQAYSPKRTFDLCFFSERTIIIIEAKVHETFSVGQVSELKRDKEKVSEVVHSVASHLHEQAVTPRVFAVALASSTYFVNVKKYGRGVVPLDEVFEGCITWEDVGTLLDNPLYKMADQKYRRSGRAEVLGDCRRPERGAA